MALTHTVTFTSVPEMILEVVDIYIQFPPLDPVPDWWQGFVEWTEGKDVDGMDGLEKELKKVERTVMGRPDWWAKADAAYRSARTVRTIDLCTEPYDDSDDDDLDDEEDEKSFIIAGDDDATEKEEGRETEEKEPADEETAPSEGGEDDAPKKRKRGRPRKDEEQKSP